jgi:hypothetical protein
MATKKPSKGKKLGAVKPLKASIVGRGAGH